MEPDPVFKCYVCDKKYKRIDTLNEHLKKHTNVEKPHCVVCNLFFADKRSLKRHKTLKHTTEKKHIICTICGAIFDRMDNLKQHEKAHNCEDRLQCSTCQKTFKWRKNLLRHCQVHKIKDIEKTYKCECGTICSRKDVLKKHQDKCERRKPNNKRLQKSASVVKSVPTIKSVPKTRSKLCKILHYCEICEACFSTRSNMQRHVSSHTQTNVHTCDACGKHWTRISKLQKHKCTSSTFPVLSLEKTPTSTVKQRVAKHRLQQRYDKSGTIPSSPTSKAQLVEHMINSPRNRTRKILESRRLIRSPDAEADHQLCHAMISDAGVVMSSVKQKRSSGIARIKQKTSAILIGDNVRKLKMSGKAARKLFITKTAKKANKENIRTKLIEGVEAAFVDISRKIRGSYIPPEWQDKISHYWTEDASHHTTDTKRNTVRKKIGINEYLSHPRHMLTKSYREAYIEFKSEHPEVKISEVTFRRCKPFFVKPATPRDLEQCCCQRCVSVRKVLRGLTNFRKHHNLPQFGSVYDMVNRTMCPKLEQDNYHKLDCLLQVCPRCGLNKLEFSEAELSDDSNGEQVTWQAFEYQEYTNKEGKTVKHLDLVKKKTTPKELIDCLLKLLKGFPYHLFTCRWQRKQWNYLIENLETNHAAIEMDFSENYSAVIQESAQSLYWSKTQTTIHSCVLWRPSTPSDNTDSTHLKEHWLIISDDLHHDYNFVNHNLTKIILPELHTMNIKLTCLHQRTDGCAGQYKSCNAFGDISRSEIDLSVRRIANYSASGHGKGEVDMAAGFIKTEARKAVIADPNVVINSPKDLYDFAIEKLSNREIGKHASLNRRRFFYVSKQDVIRDRDCLSYRTVAGTRQLHSICSMGVDGKIMTRPLTCYCTSCLAENYTECENSDYVAPYKVSIFAASVDETQDAATSLHTDVPDSASLQSDTDYTGLVCKDSIVAIKPSSDSWSDYFLFHIQSDGVVTLSEKLLSDYGHLYPRGTEVIIGHYYEYCKPTRQGCIYKLKESDRAVIPKDSILYVGLELNEAREKGTWRLSTSDHEDILCSIAPRICACLFSCSSVRVALLMPFYRVLVTLLILFMLLNRVYLY